MTSVPALTTRDRDDVGFLLDLGVDLIAMSFVRDASDIEDLRTLLPHDDAPRVIAKIERAEALDGLEKILDAADGIMVARGDLGVDLPPEVVPIAQRRLIARARAHNRPVIVATQMLESMTEHPRPTRAEVSDVSTAVFSGADAVMLSAETASGRYPVPAVEVMDRVCREVEAYQWEEGRFIGEPAVGVASVPLKDAAEADHHARMPLPLALARSAAQLSRDARIRAIVVLTNDGATAEIMAAARPAAPLIVATTSAPICRRLNVLWGVIPVTVETGDFSQPASLARYLSRDLGLANDGEYVLAVAGFGAGAPALTVVSV
jgi:pyruvate kinase